MNVPNQAEKLQKIALLNILLISFMLSCYGFVLGRLLLIITGQAIQITGFQILAFFVSLEALLLRYFQKNDREYSGRKISGIFAEVIMIILLTKLLSIFIEGFSTLWTQISMWQQDFWNNFFDLKSMLYILGILFIWMLTWLFSLPLNKIETDHELMEQEKLGVIFIDRRQARRRLINLIFSLGFLMIIMVSFINYYLETQEFSQTGGQSFLLILVLYFASGFVFLSINQFAIMKAYWYLHEINISSDLVKRWLIYTLLFITIIISSIIFLPNDFSVNVDSLLNALFQIFISVFTLVEFLIIFPTILIFTLISALFSGEPVQDEIIDRVQEYVPTTPQIGSEISWLGLLKSLLSWLIFISIIVFTIRFYIKNNLHMESFLKKISFVKWIKDFLRWIKEGFSNFMRATSTNYKKGVDRIRTYLKDRQIKLSNLTGLIQRKPPREVVINTYWEWIQWNNKAGIIRKKAETPLEYAQTFIKLNNEAVDLVNMFTSTFIAARYTNHIIDEAQAQAAEKLSNKLKETLKQLQEKRELTPDG